MAISLTRLLAFDGPNRYSPQPAVLIQFSCDTDCSTRLRQLLKDAAQQVGIILAYLEVEARQQNDRVIIELRFTTPTPRLGAAVGQYLFAALRAEEQNDQQWDAEEQLWLLQKRRRAEALPVLALQLLAEASHRGIPAFVQSDGTLQLGYGVHGINLPARPSTMEQQLHPDEVGIRGAATPIPMTPVVEWAQLSPIPLVAFSGHPQASAVAATAFQKLQQGANSQPGPFQPAVQPTLVLDAGFDRVRTVLAERSVESLVIALSDGDLATRGLAFSTCSACAIVGLPERDEPGLAESVGLPLLVTEANGLAALDADTPAILALSAYAPCPIVLFSRFEPNIAQQRAGGQKVVFVRADSIIAAVGAAERELATLQATDISGQLAAWALWWGMNDTVTALTR